MESTTLDTSVPLRQSLTPQAAKLSLEDKALLHKLLADGKLTQYEIADRLSITQTSVSYWASKWFVRPKDILAMKANEAAIHWVDSMSIASSKGDHRPAKELLLHTGHIEPLRDHDAKQVIVQIGVALSLPMTAAQDSCQLAIDQGSAPVVDAITVPFDLGSDV